MFPQIVNVNLLRKNIKNVLVIPPGQGFCFFAPSYENYGEPCTCNFQYQTSFGDCGSIPSSDNSHISSFLSLNINEENTIYRGLGINAYKYVEKEKLGDIM